MFTAAAFWMSRLVLQAMTLQAAGFGICSAPPGDRFSLCSGSFAAGLKIVLSNNKLRTLGDFHSPKHAAGLSSSSIRCGTGTKDGMRRVVECAGKERSPSPAIRIKNAEVQPALDDIAESSDSSGPSDSVFSSLG